MKTDVSCPLVQSDASGWTLKKGGPVPVETLNKYNVGKFAGRFSKTNHPQKQFNISSFNDFIEIRFDFLEVDSWDNECLRLYINDTQFVEAPFSALGSDTGTYSTYKVRPHDFMGAPNPSRYWVDQIHGFKIPLEKVDNNLVLLTPTGQQTSVQVAGNTNITVRFFGELHEEIDDESWGCANFVIQSASTFAGLSEDSVTRHVNDRFEANPALNITFAVNNNSSLQRKWGIANVNLYSAEHNSGSLQLPMTYPVTTYDAPLSTTHHKSQFAKNASSGWIMALGSRKDENVPVKFSEHASVGWFAGPFQTDKITQTISLASLVTGDKYFQLLFDFLRIDEWHDSAFHLTINDVAFVTQTYDSENPDSHAAYSVASVQQVIQGLGDSQGYWLEKYDQIHHFNLLFEFDDGYLELLNSRGEKVGTKCTLTADQLEGDGLKIDFAADTNGPTQKSWGISNVLLRSAEHPAFFDPRFNFVTLSASDASTIVLNGEDTIRNWTNATRMFTYDLKAHGINDTISVFDGNKKTTQTFNFTELGLYFQLCLGFLRGGSWRSGSLTIKINDVQIFSQYYSTPTSKEYQEYGTIEDFPPHPTAEQLTSFDLRAIVRKDGLNNTLRFLDSDHNPSGAEVNVSSTQGIAVSLEVSNLEAGSWSVLGETHVRSFIALEDSTPF